MGVCRDHCPRGHGRLPWLFDLLVAVLLVGGGGWLAGRVAPVVDTAVSSLAVWAAVALGTVVIGGVAWAAVVAVLNRRALARFAALERQAWLEREARPERQTPAALAGGARELVAAPVVRAEAFRVDERARDAA